MKEFIALKDDLRSLKDDFRRLKRKLRSEQPEQVNLDQPLEKKKSQSIASQSSNDEVGSVQPLEKKSPPASQSSTDVTKYNNHTESDLEDSIALLDDLYSAVKTLMLKLFPESYIISHSVTGKPSNSKIEAKPQFDRRLYNILLPVIKNKFGSSTPSKDVTAKVHSVQRWIQKHYTK